ncbi:hypothetical protein OS493_018146 [Desmophyllum pertusum]|uniref:Uncharacterized protein n=1 Tax=Desmophyllum pertusum TaxID=174260 RepID=A0A9W9YNG3_9CNID|nr:hypothetical protein OS493_018146 [Desmophyllum pertusum]
MSIFNLPSRQDVAFVVYKLDNNHGNPFALWKEMGSPVFPSDGQFNALRLQQEPVRSLGPRILSSDILNLLLTLPLPGISLLHVCAKTVSPPLKVEGVRLISVSSYEVLVTWKDVQSRCILSFEVLYSVKSPRGPFKQVNEVDIIFTSFHHLLSQEDQSYFSRLVFHCSSGLLGTAQPKFIANRNQQDKIIM